MKSLSLLILCQFAFIAPLFSQFEITGLESPGQAVQGERSFHTAFVTNSDDLSLIYNWDFGDGKTKRVRDNNHVTHTYDLVGNFTIKLKVSDNNGNERTTQGPMQVINQVPEIMYVSGEESKYIPRGVIFKAIVYDSGPINRLTYHLDFGDGNTAEFSGREKYFHFYEEDGYYDVTFTVDDGDGGTDTRSIIVLVGADWVADILRGIYKRIS